MPQANLVKLVSLYPEGCSDVSQRACEVIRGGTDQGAQGAGLVLGVR